MQYAIHTNELEGFVYEPEEIEFLMNVAEGKMSIEEALKIVLESQKGKIMKDPYVQYNGTFKNKS